MKLDVLNTNGEKVKTIDLPDAIYNVELSEHVLHSVVKAYRANRRQGTHSVKTRAFVRGGGRKPFKQKGTGGARQGSMRAPHMYGGAIVHGPQPRDYTQKINQKLKKLAVKMVLSDKVRHGKLIIVDDFAISGYSTKHLSGILSHLKSTNALLTDERKDNFLYYSARNLKSATAKLPSEINAEDLLRHEALVVSVNGLHALNQRLGE